MSLIRLEEHFRSPLPTALCLGTFDGVHLGHRALIKACLAKARERELTPAAFVFERPPVSVMYPDADIRVLTPLEDKYRLLEDMGIRDVFYTSFDEKICNLSCDRFFYRILLDQLNAKHLVCGFHYRFGKGAEGDAERLTALCRQNGITADVVAPVRTENGELISSTAVRRYLKQGNRDAAEKMLGRPLLHTEERLLGGVTYGEQT